MAFFLISAVYSLAVWPAIFFSRKQPIAMVAWLLGVSLLPLIGPTFFLLFGLGRGRWGLPRKKGRADRLIRGALDERVPFRKLLPEDYDAVRPELRPLLRLAENVGFSPITRGNLVRLLQGARENYECLLEDIRKARHHVHLEYFTIKHDQTGQRLADALIERAKAGISVKLMADGFGSRKLSYRFINRLLRGGVVFNWFHPLNPLRRRWSFNIRNHRKNAVIDGRIGYLGGINVADEYLGLDPTVGEWYDLAVRIEGPAVLSLQRVFSEDWHFCTNEQLVGEEYFPRSDLAPDGSLVQIISSGPHDRSDDLHQVYFSGLTIAQRQAWLVTPYFIPDEAFQAALAGAALRDVDVRVLVASRTMRPLVDSASRSFFPDLLRAEVPIYGFRRDAMIHAKALLVDGVLAVVGSANFDQRSFRINFETGALIHDERFARTLGSYFRRMMEHSRKLTLAEIQGRPWQQRTADAFTRLLSPLF